MVRRGFRPASGGQGETYHPKLWGLFFMGDGVNEPKGLWINTLDGTVIPGYFPNSYARRFGSGYHGVLGNKATVSYPWTAMFYIRFDSTSVDAYIFRADVHIRVTATQITAININGTIYAQANVSLSANTWYHVAVSCGSASGQWKMWLNGSSLNLSTNGGAVNLGSAGTSNTQICYVSSSGVNVDLDHFKVYEDQLSDNDVVLEMKKRMW